MSSSAPRRERRPAHRTRWNTRVLSQVWQRPGAFSSRPSFLSNGVTIPKLAAETKDYDDAVAAIDGSLETLGVDSVDLMLIHGPQSWDDFRGGDDAEGNREAGRALEDAYQAGKLRAIGVSNFERKDLKNILSSYTVASQVNQLLIHGGQYPDRSPRAARA